MAYDRYDERSRYQAPRHRGFDDDRDDRGFFERARDEVSSWFGDERDEYRRGSDDRFDQDRFYRRDNNRSTASDRDSGRAFSSDRDYDRFERSARWRDEGYRRPYTGRFSGRNDFGSEDRYRPMTGDYGRSSSFERDDERQDRSFGGSASGMHDRDYSSWRRRQIDELDRDYDDFRRENSNRFESEFTSWRGNRQTKRQMLKDIQEHMQVVGSDEQPVGTVDKVRGDRVILTKSDSPDGRHHAISCSLIDRIEGDRVILDRKAEEAKEQFSSEDRNRALFERDDQREEGPHMLNRSFSGTY